MASYVVSGSSAGAPCAVYVACDGSWRGASLEKNRAMRDGTRCWNWMMRASWIQLHVGCRRASVDVRTDSCTSLPFGRTMTSGGGHRNAGDGAGGASGMDGSVGVGRGLNFLKRIMSVWRLGCLYGAQSGL